MFGGNNNKIFSSDFGLNQEKNASKQEQNLAHQREQMVVGIRKDQRDKEIMKRRKMNSTAVVNQGSVVELNPLDAKIREFGKKDFVITQLNELSQCLHSGDVEKSHYGIIGIRKLISADKQPPIQIVIDANLVPKIIEFAKQSEYPSLRAEATWALSNIASGTPLQTQSIIDKGGIKIFVELLKDNNELILEQAIWAVANIAADRQNYRDSLLKQGTVNVLCDIIQKSVNFKIVTLSCWALANVIRTKPPPPYEKIKRTVYSFAIAVRQNKINEDKILAQTITVIANLAEYHSSRVKDLMSTGITERLFQLLQSQTKEVLIAVLKLLGSISYSNEPQLQALLQHNLLKHLDILLDHPKKIVKKEVCWMLSNISASVQRHVAALMACQNIMIKTYNMLIGQSLPSIKKQISHMFVNIADTYSNIQMVTYFHQKQFMSIFLKFVKDSEDNLVDIGLRGIQILLKMGEQNKTACGGKSVMMGDFIQNQGIDILQDAQMHPKLQIYELTASILKTYFEIDDPLG